MQRRKVIFYTEIAFLIFLAVGLGSFSDKFAENSHSQDSFSPLLFQDGDLIFRKGKGFFSDYFSSAGNLKSPYSHVGIIKVAGGKIFVIHTEANEFTGEGYAKKEPLETFLSDENASTGAIFRLKELSRYAGGKVIDVAEEYVKNRVPFDTEFNLTSEDRLYCTELVWITFKKSGIDIVKSFDKISFPLAINKEIITPGTILAGGKVKLVAIIK